MLTRVLLICALAVSLLAAGSPKRGLDIYFVDVEGGAATLIVTPAFESILIDNGNPGTRDAERIHQAARAAGIGAIDHFIATHWHLDHYGGTEELAKRIPIKNFYDHGIPEQSIDDPNNFPRLIAAYRAASKGKSKTLRAGDKLRLKNPRYEPKVELLTLVGMQQTIPDRPGAGENPIAKEHRDKDPDYSDNANSLGFRLRYGEWTFLDLGDLTWNTEVKLVSPTDKIGPIDVYLTTHHGLNVSNNPVIIKTVRPRVAIFNNGPRKGGHPDVTTALRAVPGIQDIWQLHRNVTVGPELNTDPLLIANYDEQCRGEYIKLSVAPDAKSYTVQIGPSGTRRRYETRGAAK